MKRPRLFHRASGLLLGFLGAAWLQAAETTRIGTPDFRAVSQILAEHCLDCHSQDEPDGELVLETHASLSKGGESGPVIIPGNSAESLLVRMVEGSYERDGKTRFMPPGRREKLGPEAVALIKAWVDAGAPAPEEDTAIAKELVVPEIEPRVPPSRRIHAVAFDPKSKLLAAGRPGEVELHQAEDQHLVRTLRGHEGPVNAVVFSPDGQQVFAAGGHAGLAGIVTQWKRDQETPVRTFEAHRDTIYGLAISPDGKILATGSYDQKIRLWDVGSGSELRTLSGHNGAIYGLAFRPDGKVLASASGDRTVKLWDVATGERRDTFSQPLKELYTVAFSPDGARVAAAGVDNRIRVWEVSADAAETSNPLLYSRFGHEGAILRVVFSADGELLASAAEDRTVKLWKAGPMEKTLALEVQPDWAPALAFILDGRGLAVGRLDGSLAYYNTADGSVLLPPKPELARLEPRGVQRGTEVELRLRGKHLLGAESVSFSDARLTGTIVQDGATPEEIGVRVQATGEMPRGFYEVRVRSGSGESNPLKLYVDDLPQIVESSDSAEDEHIQLPVTIWGVHAQSGDEDSFRFEARAGETLIFDAAAKSIGAKADLVLTIADEHGRVLASRNGSANSEDPLLAWECPATGSYRLSVRDLVLGGSADHFYRISAGALPFVTSWHPSAIRDGEEREIELIGHNLPEGAAVMAQAKSGKALEFTIPPEYRVRREPKLLRIGTAHFLEGEPNDMFTSASTMAVPGALSGIIRNETGESATGDEDWFRFAAQAGEEWIFETFAAQLGSPLDTKIEIRDAAGQPVTRVLLQAMRDSAVTFRPIDSNTMDCRVENWEEMELNQFLYLQGEVVKLFRAPQGPDSGFLFYGLGGKRRTYFDTTATVHANAEPCYIVEPHPPGTELVPNGLPVFPLYFENDDDGERRIGTDSRVHFTAPAAGTYYVRVTDSRGFSEPEFGYLLVARQPQPGFKVTLGGANPTVPRGGGQGFSLNAERIDGFDGEIRVEISDLPEGFTVSNPIVIEAGHTTASGTIYAGPDAVQPAPDHVTRVTATATINGRTVEQTVNHFGKIQLGESAPLYVTLEPISGSELVIAPGGSVPARLKIRRNGHTDRVTFSVANLPHGVIVDNIGLNGVLIPPDETEREIFLTAAGWVPETDRPCHAVSNEAGRQTSPPVLVKVRKAAGQVAGR